MEGKAVLNIIVVPIRVDIIRLLENLLRFVTVSLLNPFYPSNSIQGPRMFHTLT